MDLWIIRALLLAAILVSGYFVRPFGSNLLLTVLFSVALGGIILLAEMRIRRLSLKTLSIQQDRVEEILQVKQPAIESRKIQTVMFYLTKKFHAIAR